MPTNDHYHETGWRKEPELVEQVMALWNAGKSQQQIADVVGNGLSRNKVGGIIHRNRHLSTRAKRAPVGQAKPKVRKPRKTAVRVPTDKQEHTTQVRDEFKLHHSEYFTLPDDAIEFFHAQVEAVRTVKAAQCRFPLGLPHSFCFCPERRTRGWYCEAHAERVYRGVTPVGERGWRNRRRSRGGVFGSMQKRGGGN